jgi:hypothetical protein
MRNFAKVASGGETNRKSGKEFLRARDILRRGNTRADSPNPGGELSPNEIGEADGKILKEPLSYKPDLNKPVIGIKLSSDSQAVGIRLFVEVLIP